MEEEEFDFSDIVQQPEFDFSDIVNEPVDPRVAQAFSVSRAGKDYATTLKAEQERFNTELGNWQQARIKELQPLVKTNEDVKKYQQLFEKERQQKMQELQAPANEAVKTKFEAWKQLSSQAPLPDPNAPATPLTDFGRSAYSFVANQLPKALLLNNLQSAPRKFEDIFSLPATEVNPISYIDEFKQWARTDTSKDPIAAKAKRFFEGLAPEEKVRIQQKVEDQIKANRAKTLAEATTQDEEAAEVMTGAIQSLEDVNSLKDFASMLGTMGGQVAAQIPLSVLTKGASSFLLERAAIYENQLDQLAAENELTRQEVIDKGLDDNSGLLGSLAAAGLDFVGANAVLNSIRGGVLRRSLSGALEASTEATQGTIEEVSATAGENVEQTPGQAFVEAVATKPGLMRRGTEFIGGFMGGVVLSGANGKRQQAINDIAQQLDPKIVALQDQMATELTMPIPQPTEQTTTTPTATEPAAQASEPAPTAAPETTPTTQTTPSIFEAIDKQLPVEINGVQGLLKIDEGGKLTLESDNKIIEVGNVDNTEVDVSQPLTAINAAPTNIMGQGGVKVPRTFTKLTVNEETALRDQIKLEARAAKGGAKAMRVVLGNIADKVNEIRKAVKLPAKNATAILGRVANINLGSDLQVNRLLEYIDKIAAGVDADIPYQRAKELREKVGKAINKIAAPQRRDIQGLLAINPNELDDIQDYVDVLSNVEAFLKDPQTAINVTANAPKIAAVKEAIRQNKIALAGELGITGVEAYNEQQLDDIISGVTEETDQYDENDKVAKQIARRDKAVEMLDYSLMGLDDSAYAKSLKGIDVDNLSVSDILKVVRAAENYITNGSKDGWVTAKQQAQKGVEKTLKAGIDPNKLSLGSNTAGTTLFGMVKNLLQSTKEAAKMMTYSGMDFVQNKVAEAIASTSKLEKRLEEKVTEIFGKQKPEDARKMIVKQGVLDIIIPYYEDEDPEIQYRDNLTKAEEAFKRGAELTDRDDVKKNNEVALAYLKELEAAGIGTRQALLDALKGTKDWQLYQWRAEEMKPLDSQLKETTESYHNKTYRSMKDYAGKAAVYTLKSQDVPDLKGKVTPYGDKPTKVTMAESAYERKATLGPDQVYTLNALVNFVNGYQDVMTDILATPTRIAAREYFKDPRLNLGKGGETVAEYFWGIDNFLVNGESFGGYAASVKRNKVYQAVDRYSALLLSTFKTGLLSGPWRYVLQYAPQIGRLAIELGKDADLISTSRSLLSKAPKPELFDKIPLGIRAAMTGGTTFDDKEFRFNESGLSTALTKVEELTNKLNTFNRVSLAGQTLGDVAAAKTVWLSNYLKYLRDTGIDVENIDLASEHQQEGREEAIAYANGVTNVISGPSQRGELSPFLRTSDPNAKMVKNLFFFMGAFPLVQQATTNQAVSSLLFGTNKKQAFKDLSGVFVENTTYAALSAALTAMAVGAGKALLEGFDVEFEDKDEEEKDFLTRILSQGAFDSLPLTMIMGNVSQGYLELQFNKLLFILDDTEKTYEGWSRSGGGLQGKYGTIKAEDQYLSLVGPYLGTILKIKDAATTVFAIDQNTYNINGKEYYLSDKQANTLYLLSLFDLVAASGLDLSELRKIRSSMKSSILRDVKSKQKDTSDSPFTPQIQLPELEPQFQFPQ